VEGASVDIEMAAVAPARGTIATTAANKNPTTNAAPTMLRISRRTFIDILLDLPTSSAETRDRRRQDIFLVTD
jgi:hypothetical protein